MSADDQKPTFDNSDYNPGKALDDLKKVFPRSTADLIQQSTGVPTRTATRWTKGESRIPPKLGGKLAEQARLRSEFQAEICDLYKEMRSEGLAVQVARSALLELAMGDEFEGKFDEI